MRNILIPTDFSENAWNATKYAMRLFEQEKCTFHFLHTYTPVALAQEFGQSGGWIGPELLETEQDSVYRASQEGLHKILERIADRNPNYNHNFDVVSVYNMLIDEINVEIEKRNIDMVILGMRGSSMTGKFLFGSNALHIIRTANCPVLAIPSTFHFKYIDDILFPSDYKYHYTKKELYPIVELANLNEATVHTLHISQESDLSKEQKCTRDTINTYFDKIKHDFVQIPEAEISRAIEEYTNSNHIGLLAMTRRKHSFLERLFLKLHLSKIAMHVQVPFLMLPIK